jgi:hypothetical protein
VTAVVVALLCWGSASVFVATACCTHANNKCKEEGMKTGKIGDNSIFDLIRHFNKKNNFWQQDFRLGG